MPVVEMETDSHHVHEQPSHAHGVLNLDVVAKFKQDGMEACCSWLVDVSRELSADVASTATFQKPVKQCMKQQSLLIKSKSMPCTCAHAILPPCVQ